MKDANKLLSCFKHATSMIDWCAYCESRMKTNIIKNFSNNIFCKFSRFLFFVEKEKWIIEKIDKLLFCAQYRILGSYPLHWINARIFCAMMCAQASCALLFQCRVEFSERALKLWHKIKSILKIEKYFGFNSIEVSSNDTNQLSGMSPHFYR